MISHAWPLTHGSGVAEPLGRWLTQDHFRDNLGRAAVFAFFGISGFFITRSFATRAAADGGVGGVALAAATALADGTVLFRPLFCLALIYTIFLLGYARIPGIGAYNRLGDYSYGLYIYAFPIQQLVAIWGPGTVAGNITLSLPIAVLLAVLSWHLVEQPAMRHGASRRRTQA